MKTLIIDYGMGNLGSVKRAFEECGAEVFISEDSRELKAADHIVLPGVGAFADGMVQLHSRGWVTPLLKTVFDDKIPFLGICLGMQLLATTGYEGGLHAGLGLIPGEVKRLVADYQSTRIPHVGWNEVNQTKQNALFSDVPSGTDFYFVHSYHLVVEHLEDAIATTPYCGSFVSAVACRNIYGVQFHPEKSSRPGFQLIRNFLSL